MPNARLVPVRKVTLVALGAIVLAMPFAVWWLIGDISTTTDNPDYILEPVGLSDTQEAVIGWTSTLVLLGGVVALMLPGPRAELRRRDLWVAVPLALLGVYMGAAYRVVTAGAIGANIGGGLMVVLGILVVPATLTISAVAWLRGRDRTA